MPVIIAATDFSEVANNAIAYACDLAKATGASVLIVHSFVIPIAFSDTPLPVMPLDEGRDIAEDRIKEVVALQRKNNPDININGKVLYGDIVDCLEEYIEDEGAPWMIVVGNSGNEGTAMLGNSVVTAMKRFTTSVMAVPQGVRYEGVKKICLACDLAHIPSNFPAQDILTLVEKTGAALHVLHVNASGQQQEIKFEQTPVSNLLLAANPHYHYQTGTDADQEIMNFIENEHIDWLIIIPGKHSFFEKLFHKSHTKAMVRLANIPVVAVNAS